MTTALSSAFGAVLADGSTVLSEPRARDPRGARGKIVAFQIASWHILHSGLEEAPASPGSGIH